MSTFSTSWTTARVRRLAGELVLEAYGRIGQALRGMPPVENGTLVRILGGPLRGYLLALPDLERPSYALGTYERHVTRALDRLIQPGDVVFDVGAHVGYLTLLTSFLVGPSGSVLAFEPDVRSRAALKRNLELNAATNVIVDERIVAHAAGAVRFARYGYSSIGHIAGEWVPGDATVAMLPSVALDDVVYREGRRAPRLIKIDAEGAEAAVLLGATRLLAEQRPFVIAEVREGPVFEAVADLMRCHGYRWLTLGARRVGQASRTWLGELLFVPHG
ncbi:MAG: FkbM family methyltransferase [Chloroflexi bacterium]|nr:FkbM family methyltransferase [Chloroflexota bacterium]